MRTFILFLSFMLSLTLVAQPAQNEYRWGMAYLRSEQYVEAVKSLTKAAEKGNPAAAVQLGMLYHQGRGVEQNDERAVEYYGRAAQKGDAKGQYLLANMMQMGIGTPKDPAAAAFYYAKAARQGNVEAQRELAEMLYRGNGVQRDRKDVGMPNWRRGPIPTHSLCSAGCTNMAMG